MAAALASGVLVVIFPVGVALAYIAAAAAVAITSASARFVIVIAGGLFVMGSSDQLDAPKIAYLAFVAVSTAIALARLAAQGQEQNSERRPVLLLSGAVLGATALSLVVAISAQTSIIDVIRDAAPYALLGVAAILAWDGARSLGERHIGALITATGLIASFGFAVEFAGRRGILDLALPRLGLASPMLAALAFAVAGAAILSARPRLTIWIGVAAAVLTLMLGTGTRSALALLVAPPAMVFAQGRRLIRMTRLLGAVVSVGLALLLFGFLLGQLSILDVAPLAQRLGSVFELGQADPSYVERITQVALAWSTFTDSPLLGVGLGYKFEVVRFGGEAAPAFSLDTALAVAAKFGIVGLGLLGVAVLAAASLYRCLRLRLPEHVRLSYLGFSAISVAYLPLGNPLEDKGFALAVAMLVAWGLSSAGRTFPASTTTHIRLPRDEWPGLPREARA